MIFQLESGFGLLRVIAVEENESGTVWHLMAYEELFPSVEAAENALGFRGERHGARPVGLCLPDVQDIIHVIAPPRVQPFP